MELTAREQELVAAGGILGGFFAMAMIIGLVISVLFIIAWWKIFEKAGIKGWKSLIPIYDLYCLFRISSMSGWWCLFSFIPGFLLGLGGVNITSTNPTITDAQLSNPIVWLGIISTIALIVIAIVQTVKLAANFGKGTGFKIASVLFPNITSLILAFGSAKYNKKALHD